MQPADCWTEDDARAVLGLGPDAPLAAWRPAFTFAIRSAHPDHGGEPEDARRVIDAYRFLKAVETLRHTPSTAAPVECLEDDARPLEISVEEAVLGVRRDVVLEPGQIYRVRLPAGLRRGDLVAFEPGARRWRVEILDRPDARVRGGDLFVTVPVTSALLRRGGPLTVAMPGGERRLWVSREAAAARRLEVEGAGLPARGKVGAGRAVIRLSVAGGRSAPPWTGAWADRAGLRRFATHRP